MAAKKVMVKQSTIDQIKKLGMTAALKKAGKSSNAEYIEGVRRMYGQRRLSAAMKTKPALRSDNQGRMAKKAAVARSDNQARAVKKAAPKAATKYTSKSPKPMSSKGLFPGLLSGKYQGKKIVKGKVAGKGFFKS